MKKVQILAVFNFLCLLIHIIFSYLTRFKLVNERDVGEVSARYPTLFTPAPFTFAIWGFIYLSLAVFTVYHLVTAFRQNSLHPANKDLLKAGGWFGFNNLVTAGWLLAWTHERILLSVVLIAVQLIALIIIHLSLGIYDNSRNTASKAFTQFPLSIYFGWITIATIVNVCAWLVAAGWGRYSPGLSAINWTTVIIVLAVLITLPVIITRRNVFFGLVVIWALYGIIAARQNENPELYENIITTAWLGIGTVGITCLFQMIRNFIQKVPERRSSFPVASRPLK